MPFTANARFAALVGALLAAHFAATNLFRATDRDVATLVENKQAIDPTEPATALLVGGSGMHYGLSARQLSGLTPWNFLNLGLIVEGNGWENYRAFLAGLDMIDHDSIKLVIYSSADFYTLAESDEFTLTGARRGALLFDRESWLQRMVGRDEGFGPRSADRTVIDTETGDMVFLDGVCEVYYPARPMPAPGGNIDEIAARARDIARLFPNAEVLVRPWPVSEHRGHALGEVHAVLTEELSREGIRVLLPPVPLYDTAWACDAAFHPNAEGRDALTLLEAETILSEIQRDAS